VRKKAGSWSSPMVTTSLPDTWNDDTEISNYAQSISKYR